MNASKKDSVPNDYVCEYLIPTLIFISLQYT